jgi:aspartyl-tRNA(Asn)/glutamyl-tRNA(Gln) amidotransferase subunit A
MVELAGGGGYRYAAASLQGPGLNPWDRTRWSGGSSSGSGSAVAAGLVPFALGSETSGSILTPAAYCGLTALRPTYGLVSRRGAMALAWTMDKIGPMCRSAEDCALVLEVIAGGDKEDPGSAGKSFHYAQQFVRKFEDLKIGFAPEDFEGWAAPETRPALGEALNLFRGLGAKMIEVRLPDLPYGAVTGTVISAEGAAIFQDLIESGEVDQLADQKQIAGLKASLDITAVDYLKAMRIRRLIQEALRNILSEVDILLTPARLGIASKVSDPLDRGGSNSSGPAPASNGMRDHIPAGNLAGLPALCLPCGFAGGMPVAVSLMGRPFSENTLIAFGKAYQAQTDWHKRRPKV